MRTSIAILFTVLILSVQYARQLSFMGCELFVPENAVCECQTTVEKKNQSDQNTTAQHKHLHIDEFFQHNENPILIFSKCYFKKASFPLENSEAIIQYSHSVFKPPILA